MKLNSQGNALVPLLWAIVVIEILSPIPLFLSLGAVSVAELRRAVRSVLGEEYVGELNSVLHGLRKERRIEVSPGRVALLEGEL